MMDAWVVVTPEPDSEIVAVASTEAIAKEIAKDRMDSQIIKCPLYLSIQSYEGSKQ